MIFCKRLAALIAEAEKLDKFGTLYVERKKWGTAPT